MQQNRAQYLPALIFLLITGLAWWKWGGASPATVDGDLAPAEASALGAEGMAKEPIVAADREVEGLTQLPDADNVGERAAMTVARLGEDSAQTPGRLRVRVLQPDGTAYESGSGSLAIWVLSNTPGPRRDSNTLMVEGGVVQFAQQPAAGDRWRVFSGRLDGQEALPAGGETYEWLPGEDQWIELHPIADPEIEVRSASTGQRVGGVQLLLSDGFMPHPGSQYQVHWGPGATPHRLNLGRLTEAHRLSRNVDLWVGAEGYAWKSVSIRWAELGSVNSPTALPTTIVELEPGSRARVTIGEGELLPTVQWAGVREGELLFYEALEEQRALDLGGLPLGELEIQLFEGVWWDAPRLVGRGRAIVESDRIVDIQVGVDTEGSSELRQHTVELSFALAGHSKRSKLGVHLDREGLNRRTLLSGSRSPGEGPGRYACDPIELTEGSWRATVPSLAWSANFEVRESGSRSFTIPASKVLAIEVVEAVSLRPIESARLSWAANDPVNSSFDPQWRRLDAGEGPGQFELEVSQGEVWISARMGGYPDELHHFEVIRDWEKVDLAVEPPQGVLVEVEVAGEPGAVLPDRWSWGWTLTPIAELQAAVESIEPEEIEARLFRVFAPDPGRYRLDAPAIDGFEAVEPRTIELPAGHMETVQVSFRRKL